MKKVILNCVRDLEMGELGLIVEGVKLMNYPMVAMEGLLIAHDLLEHQNGVKAIGSINDELEALGGAWFIRGQYADMSRKGGGSMYSPEENIAADIINMGVMYVANDVGFRDKPKRTHGTDHDDAFNWMIEHARKGIISELRSMEERIDNSKLDMYLSGTLHFLRSGIRKAARRFDNGMQANRMFWNIAEAVEPYASHCDYEGQQFQLKYNDSEAYCEEYYQEDNY